MQTMLTITSKGQVTMPVSIRKSLQLKAGDKLSISYDERTKQAIISKPESIEDLSARLTSYITSGTKPVMNVDEYYQQHRGKYI